jgi:zinc protease
MTAPILIQSATVPMLGLSIHFSAGSFLDPPGKAGLIYLTAQMLLTGNELLTRERFNEQLETLGANAAILVGREHIALEGDVLSRNFDEFAQLLNAALTRPSFDPTELEKMRRQTLAELEERRDNDADLARDIFYQAVFEPDPMARPIKGTEDSLARITVDDVRTCYLKTFNSAQVTFGTAGNISPEHVRNTLVEPLTNALPTGEPTPSHRTQSMDQKGIRVILVDKPERTQTQIVIGHNITGANHPDHFPLMVGNTIFGGTFTARLCHEIREKRGWSYGAYSQLIYHRNSGVYNYRFYPASQDAIPSLRLGLKLQHDFVDNGVTPDEVAFAKSFLVNNFAFRNETAQRRMEEAMLLRQLDLPEDYGETFVHNVKNLTPETVNDAIGHHLKHDELTVVMLCTADEHVEEIRALDGVSDVTVHPFDQTWCSGVD